MRGIRYFAVFLVGIVLLFIPFQSQFASAIDEIEILDVDTYEKTIEPGEFAIYNWTIRRTDESLVNYSATINVSGLEEGWTATVTPDVIPSIANLSAEAVVVNVTGAQDVEEKELNLTVTFTIYQDGAKVLFENRTVITAMYIKPPATEKKWFFGMFENILPEPLDGDVGIFLLDVLVWLGLAVLVIIVLIPSIKLATRKTKTELDDIVLKIVRTPILVLVFTFGLVTSLWHLDNYLPEMIIETLGTAWGIIFLLVLLYLAWKLFKDILMYYGKKIAAKTETQVDDIVIPLIEKIGMVIIMMVAIMYFLGYIGIDLTMFVAGGVVVSMVLAFAAQETISNFFSGIFLMTDRPFEVGDAIILPDGDWYGVRRVGIRSTQLFRYKDATIVTIPNNKLANEKISNFSSPKDKARIAFKIGVAYGSDPEQVKEILHEVVNSSEHIVLDNDSLKPIIQFEEFGDSSLNFFVLVWVKDRSYQYRIDAKDYLNTQIYKRFNEEGIDIPFPQTTVHLKREE